MLRWRNGIRRFDGLNAPLTIPYAHCFLPPQADCRTSAIRAFCAATFRPPQQATSPLLGGYAAVAPQNPERPLCRDYKQACGEFAKHYRRFYTPLNCRYGQSSGRGYSFGSMPGPSRSI
jgi:hypothetical protein